MLLQLHNCRQEHIMQIASLNSISQADLDRIMRRSAAAFDDVLPVVQRITRSVQHSGDRAVRRYNKKFGGASVRDLRVSRAEIEAAYQSVDAGVVAALRAAMHNIETFHASQLIDEAPVQVAPGIEICRLNRPIERVGLYVPGGRAAYPSSVLMMAIPARLAGCATRVICCPPDKDGNIPAPVLVAADIAGVSDIFKAGGAQAIAAMAYGTETIPRVYKIFGPGNRYVTAAKMLAAASGQCAIDMPAGPSEVLIIADDSADPRYIAADLITQAEHADDSACVMVTTSQKLAGLVNAEIERQTQLLATHTRVATSLERYGILLVADSLNAAIDLSNRYAPEHLQLMIAGARSILPRIVNVGSVFIGAYAPAAAGDYATGSNHVLPTGEYAKMFAPLSLDSFMRKIEVQEVTKQGLAGIRQTVGALAVAEGLPAHKESIEVRFQ
jgi:histidinol dehydrogenase